MIKKRFFTVLFLEHSGPRFRKLRVSYPFLISMVLLVVVVGACGLLAPRFLLQARFASMTVEKLKQENEQLRGERDSFEGALSSVSERLGEVESRATVLAKELGIEDEIDNGAAGGPAGELSARERYWFESEVRGLQGRSERLDQSFEELGEAFRDRRDQLAATPNLIPVEGWFSHGFGWRKDPFTGTREFHRGVDIVAPADTPVVAPADGVVSRAGRFPQLGKSIDVAHGFGFVTRYAHLNEIGVQPGDRVRRGELLGLVGSTGRSTGPHLHYEIFRDGRRVNPWKYVGESGR